VLLKPVFLLVKLINTSYENSILKRLSLLSSNFFKTLNRFYENSVTARIAKLITEMLYNSAIIGFFHKKRQNVQVVGTFSGIPDNKRLL